MDDVEKRAVAALLSALLVFAGTVGLVSNGMRKLEQERLDAANESNTILMEHVVELEKQNRRLCVEVLDLTEELRSAYDALDEARHELDPEAWSEDKGPWYTIYDGTVTAYCNCEECCGKWAYGPTASGVMPEQGITVAVDPDVIPLGSQVRIEGDPHIYIAQDTGSAIKGNHIDLYFDSHADAQEWGLQNKTIYWRAAT